MGLKVEIELSDLQDLSSLTGNEIFGANDSTGKPIQISINQILALLTSNPISSLIFRSNEKSDDGLYHKFAITTDNTGEFQKTDLGA
jgi:hypothetical protein